MFTGLVEAVGELVERKQTSGGFRLRVQSPLAGELSAGEIHAEVGPETIRVTTLGSIARGSLVNLERPLRADGRIGGHFVQGHADAVGHVEELRAEAEFHWLTVSFPLLLAPFIVHKGSIAVDGVSLTVAGLGSDRFDVQLVPYTMTHTNFHRTQIRDRVNLECDVVGKYVVRAAELAGLTLARVRPGEVAH